MAKKLTDTQRTRMAKDRAEEVQAILGVEEIDAEQFDELKTFVLELYDVDWESGAEAADKKKRAA